MAFTNSGSAIINSAAFLQLQKNANLNRRTSMSDDVFRIFRQTGRRIALIKQQVEKERSTYLKESYIEKNQLYKELAAIAHLKKTIDEKSRELSETGRDLNTTSSLPSLSSGLLVSPTAEGKNNYIDRNVREHKGTKELPSINVNVLKRCECCRRRAFREVNDDDVYDEDEDPCEGNNLNEDEKAKVNRKKSQSSKTTANKKQNRQKARLIRVSSYEDVRIPATRRVETGVRALKKQTKGSNKVKHSKSVSFQVQNTPESSDNNKVKAASTNQNKSNSVTPGGSATGSARIRSRASVKLEYQATNNNDRIRLEGNSWISHVENVQEKKLYNTSKRVSGLSKAYGAFKNLPKQMDENYTSDQFDQDEEYRTELLSRPTSDCRWDPTRRSSATLPVRVNTWTTGSGETAHSENFDENGAEKTA